MTRPQAIETARRLRAGEWTIPDIRRYLAKHGHDVTWEQVKRWVDIEYETRRRERENRRRREVYRRRKLNSGILDDLLALRLEDGLSYSALIAVARRFYGVEFTDYEIRTELLKRGVEKNPNKARAAREQAQRAAA